LNSARSSVCCRRLHGKETGPGTGPNSAGLPAPLAACGSRPPAGSSGRSPARTTGLENCRQAQRSPRAVRGENQRRGLSTSIEEGPRSTVPVDLGGSRLLHGMPGIRRRRHSRLRPRRSRPALPGAARQRATPTPGTGGPHPDTGRTQRPVSTTPPQRRREIAYRRAPVPKRERDGGHCPRSALRSLRARANTAPPRARCTCPVDEHSCADRRSECRHRDGYQPVTVRVSAATVQMVRANYPPPPPAEPMADGATCR
jgi:hypothetical protein